MDDARAYASPPVAVSLSGTHKLPAARALVDVTPSAITLQSVTPAETGRGVVVRVVNNSAALQTASLRPGFAAREALLVDPLERERPGRIEWSDGVARVALRPWEIATLLFRG
jgi:alpha-mannosidase